MYMNIALIFALETNLFVALLFRVSLVQVIKLLAPIEPQRKRHFLDKKWLILLSLFMIDISTVTETFDLICLSHFTVEH